MLADEPLEPLRVISKIQWKKLKDDFKQVISSLTKMKKDMGLNKRLPTRENPEALIQGSVLRVTAVPSGITKQDIKIAVLHHTIPTYVDLPPNSQQGKIRFADNYHAEEFLSRLGQGILPVKDNINVMVDRLPAEEEEFYFKQIMIKRDRFKMQKRQAIQQLKDKQSQQLASRLHGKIPKVVHP